MGSAKAIKKGIALPFVLMVITLMLVTVSAVVKQGLGSLTQAKGEQMSKQALFTAEAGAADALRRLVEDPTVDGAIPGGILELGAEYSATISNNFAPGSGPLTASNGAEVPEGYAYILAQGSIGSAYRQVGILVTAGSSTAFGVAIGVGGDIRMQGSKRIAGTVKASGSIRMQGSSTITPAQGSGRLLAGGNIQTQGSARMDEAQDVRAMGSVSSTPSIRTPILVQNSDTSDSSKPFIADGRTSNALLPGEEGRAVLPNPDLTLLLDPTNPDLVTHTETSLTTDLILNDQIHYFPNGIYFQGSSDLVGRGTVVVGNGNKMTFQGSTRAFDANLIALGDPLNDDGTAIEFQGSTKVNGLVYSHGDVKVQGSFTLEGVIIAYRHEKGDLQTQGSSRITLDSTVFADIPGFEPWASGFGGVGGAPSGSGPISVVSWERM